MKRNDLLQTLAGCKFYHDYLQTQEEPPATPEPPRQSPPRPKRSRINRTFRKHCRFMAVLLLLEAVLIVSPLWLGWPPYGKAALLSLPPVALCALSWLAGAWWAWDRDQRVLMAVTMGAMPVRMAIILGWTCLALTIPTISILAFVICLMGHWILFAAPEISMMLELSRSGQAEPHHARQPAMIRYTHRAPAHMHWLDRVLGHQPHVLKH